MGLIHGASYLFVLHSAGKVLHKVNLSRAESAAFEAIQSRVDLISKRYLSPMGACPIALHTNPMVLLLRPDSSHIKRWWACLVKCRSDHLLSVKPKMLCLGEVQWYNPNPRPEVSISGQKEQAGFGASTPIVLYKQGSLAPPIPTRVARPQQHKQILPPRKTPSPNTL